MSADEDDEALTWAGGRDPSHYETPVTKDPKPPKRVKPRKSVPVEEPDPTDDEADEDGEADLAPATSSVLLVTMGILAGVYLLYTVGWIVSLRRTLYQAANVLDEVVFHAQQYLAVGAPVLWFAATLFFTRGHRPVRRLIWLLVGALVLIPWSFVMGS